MRSRPFLPLALALRFLFTPTRRRIARTMGTVLGVGLSLVPLVVVLQIADGMVRGISARFIETGTYHLQARTPDRLDADGIADAIGRIENIEEIHTIIAERQGIGLLSSTNGRAGVTVRAVTDDIWERDDAFRRYIELPSGRFDLSTSQSIVVGEQVAERLEIDTGDSVRLLTVRRAPGGQTIPRVSRFVVSGIFSTGYRDLDRLWVYIPLQRGLQILPVESSRQIIGIKIDDPYSLDNPLFRSRQRGGTRALLTRIDSALGGGFFLSSWFRLLESRYQSFRSTKNLLLFIMALIVCVASVNISSTLVMLILEKQSDIAILKGLGLSPRMVSHTFVLCGLIVGALATIAGIAFGLLVALQVNRVLVAVETLIGWGRSALALVLSPFRSAAVSAAAFSRSEFYLETIPIVVDPLPLLVAGALTIALATVAALLPARRAARLRPLEVIRRA